MALLSFIPARDWCWAILLAALLAFSVHFVHKKEAEAVAHETAALKASSDALVKKEAAHVAEVAKNYAASAAATTETLNEQIQAANAQHTSDADRLREYDAYRRAHPAVASTGKPADGSGTSGTGQGEDFVGELGQAGVSLADALRGTTEALSACMADRNSLTGKP